MSSRRRSQHSFWQHPVVITVSVLIAALVVAGSYLVVRPKPVSAADLAVNEAAKSEASVTASSIEASINAAHLARTAVFIGDSYTRGTGASETTKRWTTLVAAKSGWLEKNTAIGGTGYLRSQRNANGKVACGLTYCPPYNAQLATAAKGAPGIVVVSGGRNDVGEPQAQVDAAVAAFFKALRQQLPNARIIAVSPVWDSGQPPAQIAQIGKSVRAAAVSVGGTYLDIGEPLTAKPDLIAADLVHPDDAGHAALASAVEAVLK